MLEAEQALQILQPYDTDAYHGRPLIEQIMLICYIYAAKILL